MRQEVAKLMFNGILPAHLWGDALCKAAEQAVDGLRCIVHLGQQKNIFVDIDTDDLTWVSLATVHGLSMFMTSGMLQGKISSKKSSSRKYSSKKLTELGKKTAHILFYGLLPRQ